MSKLRMWLNNPNVHLALSFLLQIAAAIPAAAPFAPILAAVGGTLTATGLVIPESGVLHAADYGKIATAIADGVNQAVNKSPAGRK